MRTSIKTSSFMAGLVALTLLTVYGTLWLSDQVNPPGAVTCTKRGTDHVVMIKDSTALPSHTSGRLCDTLTIKNEDDVTRFMAFGEHDNHTMYDGVSERTLAKSQSFTVTMNKSGNFLFHDHLHDEVRGTFTVQ